MAKIEIKRIVLKVGDNEVVLSLEEARELKEILGELFGKDTTTIVIPSSPIYIETNPYRWTHPYNPYVPTYPTYPTITWQTYTTNGNTLYCHTVS